MNILAILAHHDDEALLCGGTLMRLREAGHRIHLVIATGVEFENVRDDPEEEIERQVKRKTAFALSWRRLGTEDPPSEWGLPQKTTLTGGMVRYSIQDIPSPDLIITHGDDTGHPSHATVRESVLAAADGYRVMHTTADGPIRVAIDLPAKQKLLEFYRYGTTRTPEWRPADNPVYAPWCGEFENFTADRGVVEWWGAQFPGFAGGG